MTEDSKRISITSDDSELPMDATETGWSVKALPTMGHMNSLDSMMTMNERVSNEGLAPCGETARIALAEKMRALKARLDAGEIDSKEFNRLKEEFITASGRECEGGKDLSIVEGS
eukprot:TRINITY_DN97197_c0_g1_i1.p1 TRINITY_DN97197_c0_g1~~TRINITY_DN97197_c0_g1_i1.p1  ORF type:complete len:115 (+),score=25.21 TRINITY_DN97197_c0_g1_i1:58-402(+)